MAGRLPAEIPTGAGTVSATMRRADAGADAPDEPTARRFGNSGTVVYIGTLKRSSSGELRLRQVWSKADRKNLYNFHKTATAGFSAGLVAGGRMFPSEEISEHT